MRLIDADAAEEKAWASDKIVGSSVWETSEVVEFLDDCPTVDAVVLPCKPGDHVFRLCGTKRSRYVGERIVGAVTLCGNGSWTILSSTHDTLGKTVFLTRAEAEAALAKMKGLEVGA